MPRKKKVCPGGCKAKYHECDVCKLVYKDWDDKKCIYCDFCKAWLCEKHNSFSPAALKDRAEAMVKARLKGLGINL